MHLGRLLLILGWSGALASGWAQPREDRSRDHDRERGPRVILYEEADYRGDSLVLYPGDALASLPGRTFERGGRLDRRISSIRIEGGAEIYVYTDAHYRGTAMRLTESVRDLSDCPSPDDESASLDDSISSLRVEARRREEPRKEPGRANEARVIVFADADYRGDSLVLHPGDVLENLSGRTFEGGRRLNDEISSIRIEGGAEIYVYTDANFRGAAMRVTENVRDLTGRLLPGSVAANWNDQISSLRVETRRRDEPRVEPEVIIKRAYLDLLGREPDASGLRDYRALVIDQGWTESMVRDQIRRGDEFRHEGADRIVRRAYLEVLGREADPGGLKTYRANLLEKDWTEGDVRDALRKSEEYRRKPASPR
ncbi:hypothetical protein [Opitutus sp. GAS368]|jgi:hypothetical protein|uniref:peptidase inhibitor family I36 protein n=1 Tax=Opitutus sp. GAS368 TaxID=1882749 RepID=UPI00087B18A9|nr:hypothetical protein [Opitutus sp. GAS368]SDR96904.1 Beta/Gamma crystallin [Opitutus sp. GAS368]